MKTREDRSMLCDVCSSSMITDSGAIEFGILAAHWGQGSRHRGERYEVRLCESCFFGTLSGLRKDHFVSHLFDESDSCQKREAFGLSGDSRIGIAKGKLEIPDASSDDDEIAQLFAEE